MRNNEAIVTNLNQDLNFAVVWGTVATEKGYNGMEELLGMMHVPIMDKKTILLNQDLVGVSWLDILIKSMEVTAKDE